jgi:hypothetical protein
MAESNFDMKTKAELPKWEKSFTKAHVYYRPDMQLAILRAGFKDGDKSLFHVVFENGVEMSYGLDLLSVDEIFSKYGLELEIEE